MPKVSRWLCSLAWSRIVDAVRYRTGLPQLAGHVLLTSGGLETTLIFVEGFDLPCFASFPLIQTDDGRATLSRCLDPYLAVARQYEVGFVIEAPTWRANPAWGPKLGYSLGSLADAIQRCVAFFAEIREREDAPDRPAVLSAEFGPESDGYNPKRRMSADEAEAFHAWQVHAVVDSELDMVSGLTLTYAEEAIGLVRASTSAGLPVVVSFTVETDGRLPSGQPLAEAIDQVDTETGSAAAYFMVNCAHPTHFLQTFEAPGPWERLRGVRANASKKSHAELDEAIELDAGDPTELALHYLEIRERLPQLTVLGGCCGTDHRHIARVADAWFPGFA